MAYQMILTDDQKNRLQKAGLPGMAEDTDNILFYTYHLLDYLESHNKNYTKQQYHQIQSLFDIFEALYKGF